ncbi:alpha/beta hydrolase [Streptomyces sp. KR80]|uniref:alpha/beta hydrolase n=1 Tax=Streptomyces sp. KR80 TaxID=3457426 RepID=UPI003FD665A5
MSRSLREGALVAVALLLAGAVAGCGDGTGSQGKPSASPAPSGRAAPSGTRPPAPLPSSLTGQKLRWKTCAAPIRAVGRDAKAPGHGWECATLKAPLDYSEPGGRTIGIAMIRNKAEDSRRRIGSLLFNFGGPGGSGVASLPRSAKDFEALSARYDLLSFDPRGVGMSSGVVCRDDKQLEAASRVDATPDDAAEEEAFMADGRDFAAGCQRRSGDMLPHVGTADAARDMDLMRHVLGDRKLHYFGFSYGTELGAVYAHQFPERVGRTVLDAVVDPSADARQQALHQATGFQRALHSYLKDCAKKGAACPAGADPQQGGRRIGELLERLDKNPLPTDSGRQLTQSQALIGIVAPLYSRSTWSYLTQGLQQAINERKGDLLLTMADSYNGRDERGHYATQNHSQRAISCADSKQRPTVAEIKKQLPTFRKASPVFGDFLAWDLAGWCAGWPVAGAWDDPEVNADGAGPILVVGTTGDPATPYEGAARMADELGKGVGVRITYEGEGHGAYTSGSKCVAQTVNAYLLEGKIPQDGTVCA